MEPYLIAALAVCFIVHLRLTHRFNEERESDERLRHAAQVKAERTEIALLHIAHREQMSKMFDAYREDIAQLCQRIQAPELAVVEHQQANVQDPDSFPLTDEQLSQQQELAAFVEQVERVENENLGILS